MQNEGIVKESYVLDERLRYCAHIGDKLAVLELIRVGADVNSQNKMNGWTALHWAAARNHKHVVNILLHNGADPNIKNYKGEVPANVTSDSEIRKTLGEPAIGHCTLPELPITPNYIAYPTLPVVHNEWHVKKLKLRDDSVDDNNKLILKVRLAGDTDFIEIELNRTALTMEKLIAVCCEELTVQEEKILKIRKLPNTIIRKDRDVQRLIDYQELEIVHNNKSN